MFKKKKKKKKNSSAAIVARMSLVESLLDMRYPERALDVVLQLRAGGFSAAATEANSLIDTAREGAREQGGAAWKSGAWAGCIDSYSYGVRCATAAIRAAGDGGAAHTVAMAGAEVTRARALATLHSNRAAAYMKLGDLDMALDDCDAAVVADATFAKAHMRRGQCLVGLGDPASAAEAFRAGLVADPGHPGLLAELEKVKDVNDENKQPEDKIAALSKAFREHGVSDAAAEQQQ
jgi:tetratricopeptide (TPR) repeat protein